MTNVIITFKIMPEAPDTDLQKIKHKAVDLITKFGGHVGRDEIHPVAFGLNALHLIFTLDENRGTTDDLEAQITELPHVQSVMVIDVRRALG